MKLTKHAAEDGGDLVCLTAGLGSLAEAAGMVSLLNHGAASCVYSEGCNGVTQEHLEKFAELVMIAERHRRTPQIDYDALIAAAFKRAGAAQGTRGCVQFARGAEWFREQCLGPSTAQIAKPDPHG